MKLHIRTNPRQRLLDDATVRSPEAPAPTVTAGPGPLLVPAQRTGAAEQIEPAARESPAVEPAPVPTRRRHLRHQWKITGGDDGRHLVSTCHVCGRTKSLAAPVRDTRPLDYAAELRRLR